MTSSRPNLQRVADETQDIRDNCRQQLRVLVTMLNEAKIAPATYYKGLICVAAQFASIDDCGSAYILLMSVPLWYNRDIKPVQMDQDSSFSKTVNELTRNLAQLVPTGPTAQA